MPKNRTSSYLLMNLPHDRAMLSVLRESSLCWRAWLALHLPTWLLFHWSPTFPAQSLWIWSYLPIRSTCWGCKFERRDSSCDQNITTTLAKYRQYIIASTSIRQTQPSTLLPISTYRTLISPRLCQHPLSGRTSQYLGQQHALFFGRRQSRLSASVVRIDPDVVPRGLREPIPAATVVQIDTDLLLSHVV